MAAASQPTRINAAPDSSNRTDSKESSVVYLIDGDVNSRRDLAAVLESVQLRVVQYDSAVEFLENCNDPDKIDTPACLVTGLRMPRMSGLALLTKMSERYECVPVIITTAYADVATAVEAMKRGAYDFCEKPYATQQLIETIHLALQVSRERARSCGLRSLFEARRATLTARESRVMNCVVRGLRNQDIAVRLDITKRTVELHRHQVMRKMEVASVAELVALDTLFGSLGRAYRLANDDDDDAADSTGQSIALSASR